MLTECQENKEYAKGAGTKGESFATVYGFDISAAEDE
jgi:hypothetical protein